LNAVAPSLRVHPGEGRTPALGTTLLFVTVGAETIGESGGTSNSSNPAGVVQASLEIVRSGGA
jgi:hypothetical protein